MKFLLGGALATRIIIKPHFRQKIKHKIFIIVFFNNNIP